MRRILAALAAIALLVGACAGGDEPQHLIGRPLPQQVVHVITTLPEQPAVQRTGAVVRPIHLASRRSSLRSVRSQNP